MVLLLVFGVEPQEEGQAFVDAQDITTVDNSRSSRFELFVGKERAGVALYEQRGNVRTFTHTMVFSQFEHRGLGSILAEAALDDARTHSYEIAPKCPFIFAYIRKHLTYLPLVEDSYRQRLTTGSA
jgi:predicted GNAT family acetyltransferase